MELNPTPRLLCIDDDPLQHRIVERLVDAFEHTRYAFDGAVSYEEGLAKLTSGSAAVCLLDYRLDHRTGVELLREARSLAADTPA